MILITGAGGKTGKAIVQALSAQQLETRAMVRRPAQIEELKTIGASEVTIADLANPAEVAQACIGVKQIYLICPNMHPNEISLARTLIAAAQAANIQRIVYHSVLHPQTEKMPHHWNKLRVEEMLFESGIPYTIVQPAAYMQNVLAAWPAIVDEGIYRVPYAVNTRLGMVDLSDVAEAAAVILSSNIYTYGSYELCGSQILDQTQVAKKISQQIKQTPNRYTNKTVIAKNISHAEWSHNARQMGLSDLQIEWLIKMFTYYEQFGFWGSPATLSKLLAREPNTFETFLQQNI